MLPGKIKDHILYEDKEILVCEKPAGMAVQNSRIGTMDMESALKNYLAEKNPGKMPYLGVVHRLDQPVEGILVFAKTSRAAGELGKQVTDGRMEKLYLAVTEGEVQKTSGELIDYLKRDGRTNTSSVVQKGTKDAKEARLSYQVLGRVEDAISGRFRTLVKIHLDTGRHHQIRVQMAHAGMALLGDRKYAPNGSSAAVGLALCAASLSFSHPSTGKKMQFRILPKGTAFAGFPETMKKI